ncbi:MAG: TolC family protein, partial [Eubacteriales bacterium]|nr:TolC family protein [Eubacteriales bacterium]
LLGRGPYVKYSLAALPVITDSQVNAIDYNRDVKTVLRKSTEVREADDARDDAEDQDNDDAERAAKLRYESKVDTVSQNIQKLCRAVTDKRQLVAAAESDYALAQKNFQVQETKFRNGQISQNTYNAEKATLETAANAVTTAQNNLYTAYMKYEWAMEGIVATN